jgi:KDO2-lipid IV(A) lauroyltransferase
VFLIFFVGLFRKLPSRFEGAAASGLEILSRLLMRKDRARIASNLQKVRNLPSQSVFSKLFVAQVIRNQMAVMIETLRYAFDKRPLVFDGKDEFKATVAKMRESGKGVLVVTGHIGSWELLGHHCSGISEGQKFVALAKPSKNQSFDRFLENVRERLGIEVLWSNRKDLLRRMLLTLRGNGILGMVADQKPEGRVGPVVDFLGQSTEFVAGPGKIAIQTKCAVVAAFCLRIFPGRYKIVHEVILKPGHNEDSVDKITQTLANRIEDAIQQYPEQWIWNYKRWKTR